MPPFRQHIRSAYRSTIVSDGSPHDSVMVVLPDGTLLVDLPEQAFDATETIVWIPEDHRDALQILATVHEIDPDDPRQDRRLAYHGPRREALGALITIDAIKWGGEVLGGDEIDLTNSLTQEGALLRMLNGRREALASRIPDAQVAVGIDQDGVDVRTPVAVRRLPFERTATSDADARTLLEGLGLA